MEIGEQLGNFKLLETLGKGGQAAVYKAVDVALERTVAVKVLSPELKWRRLEFERFEREAKLASALDHPNICTIYGLFEERGYHFIAMQYVAGENLHDLVERRPLELKSALNIIIQVAEALAFAHNQNIVHRDIKPRNVMVTETGRVLVLDFGLAKLLDGEDNESEQKSAAPAIVETANNASASDALHLTVAGVPYGTPASSAPEMALGEPSDFRADVFSTGVLLYFLLTGKFPFLARTIVEVRGKIVNEDPISVNRARAAGKPIPPALEQTVERALRKNPDERFQTAAELRDALAGVLREVEENWDAATATQFPAFSAAGKPYFAPPRPLTPRFVLTAIAAVAIVVAAVLLLVNYFSG